MRKILPFLLSVGSVVAHTITEEEKAKETATQELWHFIQDFLEVHGAVVFGVLLIISLIAFFWWLKNQKST